MKRSQNEDYQSDLSFIGESTKKVVDAPNRQSEHEIRDSVTCPVLYSFCTRDSISTVPVHLYTWQHLNRSSATVHWTQAIPMKLYIEEVGEIPYVDDDLPVYKQSLKFTRRAHLPKIERTKVAFQPLVYLK